MNETVFKEILSEAVMLDCIAADSVPGHKFSFKHKCAMKRIFARLERNANKLGNRENAKMQYGFENKSHLSVKRRVIIAAILILFMAFFGGLEADRWGSLQI